MWTPSHFFARKFQIFFEVTQNPNASAKLQITAISRKNLGQLAVAEIEALNHTSKFKVHVV